MQRTELWTIAKETAADWSRDRATRLSAALAYYTLLSLAPLLVLALTVAGLVLGEEAARGQLAGALASIVGPQAGEGVQTVLAHAREPSAGTLGSLMGLAALLFGASGVFSELQSSLNAIWNVAPKPGRPVWTVLRQRFFSLTMVLGVAFLLLVSLVLSAVLTALGDVFSHALPAAAWIWQVLNFAISLLVITVLFALIFRFVPDAKVRMRDVWVGAFVTAVLFTLGKLALDLYLGRASVASPFGAAGSVIMLVVWVYYAAQILFMGAEFTQVYARHRGADIEPNDQAVPSDIERVRLPAQPDASSR